MCPRMRTRLSFPKEDAVELGGSCQCGAVRFSVDSPTPYPYQACYCSICRKTAGGGGYAINLGGDSSSLRVEGEENITAFQARVRNPEDEEASTSPATRHFCSLCGSALWLYDPRWPELVHPFASAIDTPLPKPPEMVRIMLEFAAPWCDIPEQGKDERHFHRGPEESLEEWHRHHGLYEGS
jgi:hypothetical protein